MDHRKTRSCKGSIQPLFFRMDADPERGLQRPPPHTHTHTEKGISFVCKDQRAGNQLIALLAT